jgi:hypothetical protein
MTKRKPKFHKGQVVFLDEEGLYGFIEEVMPGNAYHVGYAHKYGVWPGTSLRALTKKERG